MTRYHIALSRLATYEVRTVVAVEADSLEAALALAPAEGEKDSTDWDPVGIEGFEDGTITVLGEVEGDDPDDDPERGE